MFLSGGRERKRKREREKSYMRCHSNLIVSLLFPLTNSVCRSSCACCRIFSFLFDCALTASSGFTNIRRRIILRKIPALVKPADIIMTSRHHTCRKNSFRRAVAKRITLNEVNVSRIVLIIHKYIAERIP